MRQFIGFSAGMAAALLFWNFTLNAQFKQGMAGKESDHAFLPPFLLSCLILLLCYVGVSWLLTRNHRVSRENLLRATVSFVAGLAASVAFWFAAAGFMISVRRVLGDRWFYRLENSLELLLFLGLLTFFLADRFVSGVLERRSATRQLQH